MMDTFKALQAGELVGSRRLQLACGLTEFPLEIFRLADSLEILDLTHNRLRSLPDEFACLQNLKILFLSQNDFEVFPDILAQCPKLSMIGFKGNRLKVLSENALPPWVRWLILTDNHLEKLPDSIAHCARLQKLMLAGNRLRSLPEAMVNCQNLELIRISANQLESLPPWVCALPKLSWLAYAGNPFCQQSTVSPRDIPEIPWSALTVEQPLGEGASGVTSKAIWQQGARSLAVAVKLFKGGITSDGFPADEMQAGMAAGKHPNLVQVVGKLSQHPEQVAGLVFAFIPPDYQILGHPPNFESCTRDTYPTDKTFTLPVVQQIVRGIAGAATHLHQRGILHGDLYAHNILVNSVGEGLLGDFGAASFYDPTDASSGQALERIEVRAFGCLLEDLLDRCVAMDEADSTAIARLRDVQHACLYPVPAHRPLFADLGPLL
jgi:hypothetical protein